MVLVKSPIFETRERAIVNVPTTMGVLSLVRIMPHASQESLCC